MHNELIYGNIFYKQLIKKLKDLKVSIRMSRYKKD